MRIHLAYATMGLLALAGQTPCAKQDPPSAKQDEAGKVLFNDGSFDDAKKFKTGADFEKAERVTVTFSPAAPQAHIGYYSAFPERLGSDKYLLEVFDRTTGEPAPVHSETRDAKPDTSQVTSGWTFDIPVWPPPVDPTQLMQNDVWIKPGHHYEVMVLKPFARGEFSVGGDIQAPPEATPAPTPTPKGKGKPPKKKK